MVLAPGAAGGGVISSPQMNLRNLIITTGNSYLGILIKCFGGYRSHKAKGILFIL